MKIFISVLGLLLITLALPYLLLAKWPSAKVKYDTYYNGYYISAPGILDRQVHNYNGDFYTVKGGFDKDYVYPKQIADSLFIEYKRWLKAGH